MRTLVIDASVWVSAADATDELSEVSRTFLAGVVARQLPIALPESARIEIACALARAAGADGMAGGQAIDLAAESRDLTLDEVVRLQRLKTGALFGFSCEAGAILAGEDGAARKALRDYAACIGLAFQIADDLLDHEGTEAALGKAVGKDAAAGKATFVGLLGAEEARQRAEALVDDAIAALSVFDEKAAPLRAVARYIVERRH